ncbi:MAG: uroporphyrinogen-III synthase [Saprospiraceae bacterium]
MPAKRLFISRTLDPSSPFHAFAKENDLVLDAQSLLEFTPVQFHQLPTADWLFFYSPNGVRFFFRQMMSLQKKVNTPIATIGLGTLNALKEFGKSADFAGNGHPKQVAEAFASLAQGQKVVFIRAQQSRKSIQNLIADQITVLDLVVYANAIQTNISLPEADYLVFTSPMNVQAYTQNNNLTSASAIIAIGKTTASALYQAGVQKVFVANQPNEAALIEALKGAIATQ